MKNWIVDHAHSIVGFEVRHMMVSKVRGQFESFTANVEAEDLTDLTTATIQFQFDAESINTRIRERDKHLKSADFFDIKKYPTIDFKSTHITRVENLYKVTGDLTIKSVTKSVTFDVAFGGKAIDPRGLEVYGYEAEATINREEFDLTWNAALETGGVLVGKEVKIKVELELSDQKQVFSNTTNSENPYLSNNKYLESEINSDDSLRLFAENLTDLVLIMNRKGNIQYVNPSLQTLLQTDALSDRNFFEMIPSDERDIIINEIISYSNRTIKKALKSEFRLLNKDGKYLHVEADIISFDEHYFSKKENECLLVIMRDISERKKAEKEIYQLAFHDQLTNLPNRRTFMNQLRNEVMDRKFTKSRLSVFFIDLDNFKQINDQWGHDAGDVVLKEAAKRIQSVLRPTDLAARFGGDEFVVMLKDVRDEEGVFNIIQRLLTQFQKPINESGQDLTISCSIGVAHYPNHGDSPEDLIHNADTALYYVKERGKNDFMVFNQQMEEQSLERRLLENALRQGIKEKQFYLEYQPKINIKSNKLIGMEALVRWNHPELGIISPGKFIPLAEESGLIAPLGEWILRESTRQAAEWQTKDFPALSLSVNISVRQLEDRDFVKKLTTILHETGLDPTRLELEITESVLANVKSTLPVLKEIRKLGIQISIDDFGTGYSSLSYIKELPIDTLKIDQSFVRDIHTNKESKEIARAIINLAQSIGLNVIAEGIELEEHVDELSEDGCILGQGYFYSRPLKVEAFEDYMLSSQEAAFILN